MGERTRIFNLRYSDRERDEWRAGAAAAGMNLTQWIRHLIGAALTEGAAGDGYPKDTEDRSNGDDSDAKDRLPPPDDPVSAAPSVSARLSALPAARAVKTDFKQEKKK
jgi:hypothetical protein